MTPRARILFALALMPLPVIAFPAMATCDGSWRGPDNPARVGLRLDNDALGSASQDHGYSNGLILTRVSPNLAEADDACLPPLERALARHLRRQDPEGSGQRHLVTGISHGIYTPDDKTRSDLIEDDRPYAGVLLLSLGYIARDDDRLRTSHLRLGVVGPSARGQQVQDAIHRVIDVRRAQGWQHQLRDEPLLQLVHERMRRWPARTGGDCWGWDAIGHAGGSLGNFATHANAGAQLRLGWRLPDDFGSDPLRPAAGHPAAHGVRAGWSWHAFVSVDTRAVLRDITLDGNTFKASHSVERKVLVGDLGYGLVVSRGRWTLVLAQYQRSREFKGQLDTPSFGSLAVSRAF